MYKELWWEQIPTPRQSLQQVVEEVLNGKSVVLSFSGEIPWKEEFMAVLEEGLCEDQRTVVEIDESIEEPGDYLLEHYCKKEMRARYRRGSSYGEFLAKTDGTSLDGRILYIKKVEGNVAEKWWEFVNDYHSAFSGDLDGASFILEMPKESARKSDMKYVKVVELDNASVYEKKAFIALAVSELECDAYIRPYLAELAITICQEDVELAEACVRRWRKFLDDPWKVLQEICQQECRSDGSEYKLLLDEAEVAHCIWETQLKQLFPCVENFRINMIKIHQKQLSNVVKDLSKGVKTDVKDLELNEMCRGIEANIIKVNDAIYKQLEFAKNVRNDLAHLQALDLKRVKEVLTKL